MNIVRLLILYGLLIYAHFRAFSASLDLGGIVPTIGGSALLSFMSILLYFYGKWFLHMYKKSLNIFGNKVFIFENILLPIAAFHVLTLAISGGFSVDIFMLSIVGVVVQFDASGGLSDFLWKYRSCDFTADPDDGIVDVRRIDKGRMAMISFYLVLPVAAYFIRYAYPPY